MSGSKAFASLSPTLLARKGGASPAMRPQLQPVSDLNEDALLQDQDDLGWNDMGEEGSDETAAEPIQQAEILSINGTRDIASKKAPKIVQLQKDVAERLQAPGTNRRSALADGRRAAFTLRIDAERHLKLRLASAVTKRSAQQIVTEALDNFLNEMSDIQVLAKNVRKRS